MCKENYKVLYDFLKELKMDTDIIDSNIEKKTIKMNNCFNNKYIEFTFNVNNQSQVKKICDSLYGYFIEDTPKYYKIGCTLPKTNKFLIDEYDRCNDAFELYSMVYKNFNKDKKEITFVNLKKKKEVIEAGGDIDFNFKMEKVKYFKDIVENGKSELSNNEKRNIINKLLLFHELTYHPNNISIMPVNGALNLIKQSIGNDRLDTFIYIIKLYYDGITSIILNYGGIKVYTKNRELLKGYLDSFSNIYDYCRKIYHIEEDLTNELLELGSKAIDTPEMVDTYLNYALKFWSQKSQFYTTHDDIKVKKQYKKMIKTITESKGKQYIDLYY